jgi:hypothetical protein
VDALWYEVLEDLKTDVIGSLDEPTIELGINIAMMCREWHDNRNAIQR